MFTGLVEATGNITHIEARNNQARFWLQIPFQPELQLGDSVAVNGCCLTVAEFSPTATAFDILTQTLSLTHFSRLHVGTTLNLERALSASSRLGGHIVQGHIDTTAELLSLTPHGQDHRLEVAIPASIRPFCLEKGSLTIDGISLTIAELHTNSATFWITPHTYTHTHLSSIPHGHHVNLEADYLTKIISQTIHQIAPNIIASLLPPKSQN